MTVNTIENKKRPAEVMLIEDNRGDAILAALAFSQAKIPTSLSCADSAEQALAMLRKENGHATCATPDLILLDLNLPKMHGQEFLEIVKADAKLKHIPVVILSSSRAKQDVVNSYSHYASGYVVTPIGLERIRDLVAAIQQFFFVAATLPDVTDVEPNGRYS
jgi:CheY-like chemotaxis protein